MSYARWGCDGSDVYVYAIERESCGDWELASDDGFRIEVNSHKEFPCAGETFDDANGTLCAKRLEWLRSVGYSVPQYAIDTVRAEV